MPAAKRYGRQHRERAAKAKAKTKRVNWRKAAIKLAKCCVFALAADKHLGRGSGTSINLKTRETRRWQEQFFDALDTIGVVYDREAYYKQPAHQRRA